METKVVPKATPVKSEPVKPKVADLKKKSKAPAAQVKAGTAVAASASTVKAPSTASSSEVSALKEEIAFLKSAMRVNKDDNVNHLDRLIKQLKYQ